jgi:hypothetical protein
LEFFLLSDPQENIFPAQKQRGYHAAAPFVKSGEILEKKRNLYQRSSIFPKSMIDYMAHLLKKENDSQMNAYLIDLPADDRLLETHKIMHKDIHKH